MFHYLFFTSYFYIFSDNIHKLHNYIMENKITMSQYLLYSSHTWVCKESLAVLNSGVISTYVTWQLKEQQETIKVLMNQILIQKYTSIIMRSHKLVKSIINVSHVINNSVTIVI